MRVIAVDLSPAALQLAAECGAATVINAAETDPVAAIGDLTGGVHLSLDCAGSAATAVQSVQSLRRRGRHIQVGLLFGPDATPPLPLDRIIAWELSVHGSHGMAAADYPALLQLVTSGAVQPGRLITATTDLAGAGRALTAMADHADSRGITVAVR